jgi:hypothetical protein
MKHEDILLKCSCKSEFQDKEHKGLRVGTPVNGRRAKDSGQRLTEARCTVCGKTHQV